MMKQVLTKSMKETDMGLIKCNPIDLKKFYM